MLVYNYAFYFCFSLVAGMFYRFLETYLVSILVLVYVCNMGVPVMLEIKILYKINYICLWRYLFNKLERIIVLNGH